MDLMTTAEVADYLRTPEATLRYWKHRGEGPRCFKMGRRVMYRRQDVDAWLMGQINAERDEKIGPEDFEWEKPDPDSIVAGADRVTRGRKAV